MIVALMLMISARGAASDEKLCRVEIDNINDRGSRADYRVRLYARGETKRLVRETRVLNWPKKALPAWRLLSAAMVALEDSHAGIVGSLDAKDWK